MYIIPDWSSYQSYKDRRPTWLRLHVKIIDNFEFQKLSDGAQALLPQLWVLASEHPNPKSGIIAMDIDEICFRLRKDVAKVAKLLIELERAYFVNRLQNCNDSVTPETEKRQRREETDMSIGAMFDEDWKIYPRKVGKGAARIAYSKALKKESRENIVLAIRKMLPIWAKTEKKYIPHFSTWLNEERWQDEIEEERKKGSWGALL